MTEKTDRKTKAKWYRIIFVAIKSKFHQYLCGDILFFLNLLIKMDKGDSKSYPDKFFTAVINRGKNLDQCATIL